jgi:UDP-N-acetylmuramate--alanine ligase
MVWLDPSPPIALAEMGRVHLVGIGGVGMSGLARIMLARGVPVSGSDIRESEELDALRRLGATVTVGHDPTNVAEVETVVHTSAAGADNPELVEARRRGLRILPRAAALASLMLDRRAIAITGTHGKTTTASMLTVILEQYGADPSFAIGGHLSHTGTNAHDGSGEFFVAEADESDASFLHYRPELAVITNIDPLADHLDFYESAQRYRRAFEQFLASIPDGGHVVGCADDDITVVELARSGSRLQVHSYGRAPGAELRVSDIELMGTRARYVATLDGDRLGPVELSVPGAHNVLNSAGALLAAIVLGFPEDRARRALGEYRGTGRRMESKGSAGGVRVFDSYAHHPSEIVVDLAAARAIAGHGRVIIVFQPHLYSRTRFFAPQFAQSLGLADEVVVMDVYASREAHDPMVSGELIASAVGLPASRVAYAPKADDAVAEVASRVRPGDVVLTSGAGDVTKLGASLLRAISQASPAKG